MDSAAILSIVLFLFILIGLVALRVRNSQFEIKPTDIVVGLLPIVIILLASGKIKNLKWGDLTIETAFVDAARAPISDQVSEVRTLPVETVRLSPKEGVGAIPRLIDNQTEALFFQLKHGGYYGPAIMEYLDRLTRYPFLKYVVIVDPAGRFFGLADARKLALILRERGGGISSSELADWLNRGDEASLKKLPGFIGADEALQQNSDRTHALERMEGRKTNFWPVVSDPTERKFLGTVEHSRLVASLLLDVNKRIKKED